MDAPEQMQQQPLSKKERRELRRQAKLEHREQSARKQTTQRLLVWGGVLAALALVVLGLIKLGSGGSYTSTYNGGLPPVTSDDWVTGSLIASTTLIEYGDYQCPACATYAPVVTQLATEFGADVAFVFRHFPLPQHSNAVPMTYAAEAAGRQGKFWEMTDVIYANQQAWQNADSDNVQAITTEYAKTLGLNTAQFEKDFTSSELRAKTDDQISKNQDLDAIQYTPSFFLNGTRVAPRSYPEFQKMIADAVAASKN
jgi:protein-disulfide isomerase